MKIRIPSQLDLNVLWTEEIKPVLDEKFNGNVTMIIDGDKSTRRDGMTEYNRVRVRVLSSKGPGAGRSFRGRRSASGCWHAFGEFFDALGEACPEAMIYAGLNTKPVWKLAKDHGWIDWRQGNAYVGFQYASEMCECGED